MKIKKISILVLTIFIFLNLWTLSSEPSAYSAPNYQKKDISHIINKTSLNEYDYRELFLQTGLGKYPIDILLKNNKKEKIKEIQDNFFNKPLIICEKNSIISKEESIIDEDKNYIPGTEIICLEDGDILITLCSHTFGWRNGHAAIVIDSKNRLTLESVVLGEDSKIQTISKWENYPSFAVYRLKGVSAEKRKEIAESAAKNLNKIPYSLMIGILNEKYEDVEIKKTHCSHLVWAAFYKFGYDIDGNGGTLITPKDITKSNILEIKQIYGINPLKFL